jgi:hypothetical protein
MHSATVAGSVIRAPAGSPFLTRCHGVICILSWPAGLAIAILQPESRHIHAVSAVDGVARSLSGVGAAGIIVQQRRLLGSHRFTPADGACKAGDTCFHGFIFDVVGHQPGYQGMSFRHSTTKHAHQTCGCAARNGAYCCA